MFRRLRLGDVFEVHDPDKTEQNSEKGFEKKTTSRGKRWLPNEMALKWIKVEPAETAANVVERLVRELETMGVARQ